MYSKQYAQCDQQLTVSCFGEQDSGHPLIYLDISSGFVKCPYCSKEFTRENNDE